MNKVGRDGTVVRYDDVITTIRKSYHSFTDSQTKVADYVVANSLEVLGLTISELARKVGVSDPTVTRFCYALRLTGYPQLRKLLAAALSINSTERRGTSNTHQHPQQLVRPVNTSSLDLASGVSAAANHIAQVEWVRVAGVGAAGKLAEIIGTAYAPIFPDLSSIVFDRVDDLIAQIPLTKELGVVLLISDFGHDEEKAEVVTTLSIKGIDFIDLRSILEATNHSRLSLVKKLHKENAAEAQMRTLLVLAGAASELLDTALAAAHAN